jgi:hypothetical protein
MTVTCVLPTSGRVGRLEARLTDVGIETACGSTIPPSQLLRIDLMSSHHSLSRGGATANTSPVGVMGECRGVMVVVQVLAARAVRAAHCLTSIQFSPTSEHLMLAYGRRHVSLMHTVPAANEAIAIHTILEVRERARATRSTKRPRLMAAEFACVGVYRDPSRLPSINSCRC